MDHTCLSCVSDLLVIKGAFVLYLGTHSWMLQCVCVAEELSWELWLPSTMLLLSRRDRSEPAVSGARWMSAAWVKTCFCLLSLGYFYSTRSRAPGPGQGALLQTPCAGESWQMYLDMILQQCCINKARLPPTPSHVLWSFVFGQYHF